MRVRILVLLFSLIAAGCASQPLPYTALFAFRNSDKWVKGDLMEVIHDSIAFHDMTSPALKEDTVHFSAIEDVTFVQASNPGCFVLSTSAGLAIGILTGGAAALAGGLNPYVWPIVGGLAGYAIATLSTGDKIIPIDRERDLDQIRYRAVRN